MHKLVTVLH